MDVEPRPQTPTRKNQRGKNMSAEFLASQTISSQLTMKTKEFALKIQSIDHFVHMYGTEGKYFLPPRDYITWEYVKQIATGEKVLLKFDRIECQSQVPKARGLRVRDIFSSLTADSEFLRYFPNMTQDSTIPRKYFLTVE
jgi:hypothetical protein